jgi:hypothetical protein
VDEAGVVRAKDVIDSLKLELIDLEKNMKLREKDLDYLK